MARPTSCGAFGIDRAIGEEARPGRSGTDELPFDGDHLRKKRFERRRCLPGCSGSIFGFRRKVAGLGVLYLSSMMENSQL